MSSYERFRDPDDSQPGFWCGPNDGGIERGDSADTGDEEAGPTDGVNRIAWDQLKSKPSHNLSPVTSAESTEAYLECTATQLKAGLADDLLGSFTHFDQ
jgi:hypothetical protein